MPDYFVPIDTTYQSDYYRKLIRRGIMNTFVLNYVDNNRKKLHNKFEQIESFNAEFDVSDDFLKDLTDFADKEGLALDEEDLAISGENIKLVMKSYIARDLWNTNEFYQVINKENHSLLKAIEVLEESEMYQAAFQN